MRKTRFNRKPLYAALMGSAVAMAGVSTAASAAGFVNPPAEQNPLMLAGSCNPCAAKKACGACNPCAAKKASSACNPCAAKKGCGASNPCNPCAAKKKKTNG